jgi:hypothetical protein
MRAERVATGKRRVTEAIDVIVSDTGPELRRFFAHFSNNLLNEKVAETTALFNALLPPGSIAGISNTELVHASMPVVLVRQVSNWCSNHSHPDPQEELEQLRELPRKWLTALRRLLEGGDPFHDPAT